MIIEEQASKELLSLIQKKDKDFYTYYCYTEILLAKIAKKDQVTHNRKNTVILNKAKQHILKNKSTKFLFKLRNLDLCFCINE